MNHNKDLNSFKYVFNRWFYRKIKDLVLIYLIGNSVYTEFNKRTSEEIDQVINSNIKAFILLIQEFSNFCLKNKIKGNNTILGPAKIGNFVNDGKTLNKNQISFMNDF